MRLQGWCRGLLLLLTLVLRLQAAIDWDEDDEAADDEDEDEEDEAGGFELEEGLEEDDLDLGEEEDDVDHDFADPQADHSKAGREFDQAGQWEASEKAFRAAVKFQESPASYMDLGVFLMRRNRLDEAEVQLNKAEKLAEQNMMPKTAVKGNLDALEQHMAFRRGEKVHAGLTYRRRSKVKKGDSKSGKAGAEATAGTYARPKSASQASSAAASGKASSSSSRQEENVQRKELNHQMPSRPRGVPFRRVTRAELDKKGEELRREPFVLTDAMEGWRMLKEWPTSWRTELASLFPRAVTDFYPFNMLTKGDGKGGGGSKPYLVRLPKAIEELEKKPGAGAFGERPPDESAEKVFLEGRYLHLQLTPSMWQQLQEAGHFPDAAHLPPFLDNEEWLDSCFNEALLEEWNLKTHWKVILLGMPGAGMFEHVDSLQTSSWHAHIKGKKWWHVCGNLVNQSHVCFEEVLKPGQVLYYPPAWAHITQCLDSPSITLTDTVAHEGNAEGILRKTFGECTGKSGGLGFHFSAKLCDALDVCTDWWMERAGKLWKGPQPPSWRQEASKQWIGKKERILPEHNNYDGRNNVMEGDAEQGKSSSGGAARTYSLDDDGEYEYLDEAEL
eukprot:TRINITY_DN121065_c0_g1_i1.p1 TRINITY_DN121065_c0_g1~~TRINITY_DN121065_c0_g1_i1.p1  ORF type:complete len:615 (+),score=196.70 TRINITY_DN121065_c0_g1_i1:248-2092(+)